MSGSALSNRLRNLAAYMLELADLYDGIGTEPKPEHASVAQQVRDFLKLFDFPVTTREISETLEINHQTVRSVLYRKDLTDIQRVTYNGKKAWIITKGEGEQ